MWSAGRRLSPIARRKETPSHGVSGGLAGRSGSFARSRVSRRSAPLVGERDEEGDEGLPGADTKNTGDDARLHARIWAARGSDLERRARRDIMRPTTGGDRCQQDFA